MKKMIRLQRFTLSDTEQVRQLHRIGLDSAHVYAGDDYYAELADINHYYLQQGGDFWLFKLDDHLVGMGGWKPIDGQQVKLTSFSVAPQMQGQRLGRTLVELCLLQAQQKGYHTARLRTSERQQAAQKLYARIGFKLTHVATDPTLNQHLQAQKALDPTESLQLLHYELDLTTWTPQRVMDGQLNKQISLTTANAVSGANRL